MKHSDASPQYLKVKRHILAMLREGALTAHHKLPTERSLSEELRVNRNTIRHALGILEREGAIYRSGRRGWFASGPRLVFDPSREHVNFDKLARSQGFNPGWKILESGSCLATGDLQELFDTDEGTPLYYVYETGTLDGQHVYYSEYFFLAEACPGFLPKIVDRPMTDVLRTDYGVDLSQKSLLIRPISLSPKVSGLLDVPPRFPGIFYRRVKSSQDNIPVQLDYEYWRADAIEMRSYFD